MKLSSIVGEERRARRIVLWLCGWLAFFIGGFVYAGLSGALWRIDDWQPYLLRGTQDNWLHNAFSIYSVADLAKKQATMVYVGGSVCLEGLPSDDFMSHEIERLTGRPARFISVCSPYQNFADELRIVEALGAFDGTVILGTEPVFYAKPLARQFRARSGSKKVAGYAYFFLPYTERVRVAASLAGLQLPVYESLKEYMAFGPRAIAEAIRHALTAGPTEPVRHRISKFRDVDYVKFGENWRAAYRRNVEHSVVFRTAAVNSALAHGNNVLLVEIPGNEEYVHLFQPARADYEKRLSNLLALPGVSYASYQNDADWPSEYFNDTHHLTAAGRSQFALLLAQTLAGSELGRRERVH